MSDPYHTYDNHNIQMNVFHIKEPLKGNLTEKDKQMHQLAYLFNPKDPQKPEINFPKTNIKMIKENIYLSDSIEIVYRKISKIMDLPSNEIYAWIDHRKEKKSLLYTKPLGITYDDLEDCKYMNPYLDKKIDDRFVNSDSSEKRNSLTYLDRYKILNTQIVDNHYNIYFTTLKDVIEYSESIFKEDEKMIKYGYLKKYFPLLDISVLDDKIDEKIEIMDIQKSILDEYDNSPVDIRPIHLIYENKEKNIVIDLFKIFQVFPLSIDIPMLKIQTDNYMDSYIKFYKGGINNSYSLARDKNITSGIFERWNKNIYLSDGFSRPRGIDKKNSLTFTIYDKKTLDNIQMILYIDGRVRVYSERFSNLDSFNDNIIQSYLRKVNSIIKNINVGLITSIPEIIKTPVRIDISSIYEISDYHLLSLKKLFNSFYTQFILLTDEDDKLHLLYSKCDDFENMKYITDTITLCKRKKILDKNIIEILMNRYGLTKTKSKEYLDEWLMINATNPIRYREEIKNISIIIEKVLDRIKVSFYGLYNYSSFHECIDTVNRIMNIYKLKRVDKRKDLPEPIEKLFKKTNIKNIVISQPEIKDILEDTFEPEPDIAEPDIAEPDIAEPEDTPEHTDEVIDEDSDIESDSDSDDDEYEFTDIDFSAGMKGGSNDSELSEESKYPNSRYYIKRLEMKDPRLIKYKPKSSRDGYAAKCQAAQDKQPIALTSDELEEIDKKTGFKNLGISYSKPVQIIGGERENMFYICPKFWDRKHQIPIDPKSKYHPIEKDEEGNPIEWKQFVWSKEYKNSDGDYFILERSGRGANKSDSSSYWNKDRDKDNIEKYQVQLIHDDVHPELLALPCCGKKSYKINKKTIIVLVNDERGKNKWVNGEIISDSELIRLNDIHECKINIGTEKKEDIRTFHISQIKEKKGHSVSTNIADYTEFPLKENKYGKVNNKIKDIFFMKPNAPFIKKGSAKKDIEMSHNGFFRVGVIQDNDSFLRCIEYLRKNLVIEDIRKYDLKTLKKIILKDLDDLSNDDIFNIGNGSFVQYFRSENIYDKKSYENLLISDVKGNLKNYLNSDEMKDHKLLIPLIMKCSEKSNKLFGNLNINIFVLSETYEKRGEEIINTKISLSEPLGGLTIYEGSPFLIIYQRDDYYEALMYYYNGKEYSIINDIKDDIPIDKNDIIYISNEVAKIIKVKEEIAEIKYDNEAKGTINIKDCIKYDISIVYKLLNDFINNCKSKSITNKKEIIQFEDLDFIMREKLNCNIIEGYYDNYHKLVAVCYKKDKGSLKIPVFFKPRNKDDVDFPLKKIKSMDKYSLGLILRLYSRIDEYINEIYPNKYLSFIDDKSKVIVNDFNLMIGYFMNNGFIVPLKNKKYNESIYKYQVIKGSSILSLQNNSINPFALKDQADRYFLIYNERMNNIYDTFSQLYDNIRRDDSLKREVKKIVNHPIKLTIHKRWDLYDLLKDIYDDKKYKNLKIFIEYLLIHDLDDLQKILFHNYSSLKDYKMNLVSDDTVVLTMKDFLTQSYLDLFEKHSEYIRNISYYEYSNPNVNKTLLKREYIEKPVSEYSKYPNTLKKIFGKEVTIYKNIISEDRNDINIISRLLDDISLERIRGILIDTYSEDDDSYILHNDLLGDIYKNNRDLLSSISEKFYKLSLIDYEILSEELGIGFVIFSNRYSNDINRYKTHIIVHKSLKDNSEKDIKMLCLYEDLSEEVSENTECKPISIKESLIHKLGDLRVNREFNRLYNKS